MRLAEIIGRWLGRVEVVIAGADEALQQGETFLANGNPMAARSAARAVLERVPGSPLGLALLADACELASLHAELALTLEELALRVGSQADVWVRLGRARYATHSPIQDVRDAYVRGLAVAEAGSEARHEALLALADLDLSSGDGARADLWLDRIAHDEGADVMTRRAQARLARGDGPGALSWVGRMGEAAPTDARGALVRGKAWALANDPRAFPMLLRATVLDEPGASELLSSSLAHLPTDDTTRERIRLVVAAKGELDRTRWRAAFARAEGRREEARRALMDAVAAGDRGAASALLEEALEDRDYEGLRLALASIPEIERRAPLPRDLARLPPPNDVIDASLAAANLDALAKITEARVLPWADAMRQEIARALVPASGRAVWSSLLARLDRYARELHELDASSAIAALAGERTRPVRVAIVGEFNAGKSTFINALMGADVAPTGVLPTTATLHHLRYATDPIARVHLPAGVERIVPVAELRATLASSEPGDVRRVEIMLPIAGLTRVEIIDTPGFNAPEASHAEAARTAFEEADAVVWLLDATQAMKKSEREVLEELRAARLPIQVLVNKADRLKPEELAQVMRLVTTALEEAAITSWSKPLAFSAKLALRGKLGDDAALAASGWPAIDALLDRELVGRSELLKERALRRRAAAIITSLGKVAAEAAQRETDAAQARSAAARDVSKATVRLDREAETLVVTVESLLTPAFAAWNSEMALVVTGRDAKTIATDPLFAIYRTERALALIVPALAAALTKVAGSPAVTVESITPIARALVRGFVANPAAPAPLLARAALAALTDFLGGASILPSPGGEGSGRVRELMAIADALSLHADDGAAPHPTATR